MLSPHSVSLRFPPPNPMKILPPLLSLALSLALVSCPGRVAPEPPPSFAERHGVGDEIIVGGERFPVGAPVVTWFEAPYYSAYSLAPRFSADGPRGLRYTPGRAGMEGTTVAALRDFVDLFVLHYDVCGTSRTCFKVLQDQRRLSVHFLLDVDGTIYQTLDLVDQGWHARQANPRSVGVEIAQIGCYLPGAPSPLDEWYEERDGEVAIRLPARFGDGGVRTPDFVARPARPHRIHGEINGETWEQYDFTPEQYASLEALTAALVEIFPRLAPDAPRDENGTVRGDVLSDEEFDAFSGVLAHWHVTRSKRDPGPAFDWDGFLARVRARIGASD